MMNTFRSQVLLSIKDIIIIICLLDRDTTIPKISKAEKQLA